MRWISVPVSLLLATQILGAEQSLPAASPAKRIGFPWFIAPRQPTGTAVLPDAPAIWRRDTLREERKEREHWKRLREAEEHRIRDRYRIETEAALQGAVAAAEARLAFGTKAGGRTRTAWADDYETGRASPGGPVDKAEQDRSPADDLPPRQPGANNRTNTATPGAAVIDKVSDAVNDVVDKLDNAADALAPPTAGRPRSSNVVFFLLLLALFLVPAFAVALLLLAFIHFRNGHRLQSAVFGVVGAAVAVFVVATARDMRAQDPANQQAEADRLRKECESSAVSLSGYIYDVTPDGMLILGDVVGARGDENGWVVIVTQRLAARSGKELKLRAYPVGERSAPNALGLVRNIPAYSDTLDDAIAWRAEAERMASEWWWQRLTRFARKT